LDTDATIQRFDELARRHAVIDYGDPESVRQGNEAVDEMRAIARDVATSDDTSIIRFIDRLEPAARPWVAFGLLDADTTLTPELEARCLAIVETCASGTGTLALGAKSCLRDWRSKRS